MTCSDKMLQTFCAFSIKYIQAFWQSFQFYVFSEHHFMIISSKLLQWRKYSKEKSSISFFCHLNFHFNSRWKNLNPCRNSISRKMWNSSFRRESFSYSFIDWFSSYFSSYFHIKIFCWNVPRRSRHEKNFSLINIGFSCLTWRVSWMWRNLEKPSN